VVEFASRSDTAAVELLPSGTKVLAACRDGGSGVRFSLTNSVVIDRMLVAAAKVDDHDEKSGLLDIELARTLVTNSDAWPERLDVFLLADPPVVWTLRYALLRRLATIEVAVDGIADRHPTVSDARVRFRRRQSDPAGERP
jgi:hypothetical protein